MAHMNNDDDIPQAARADVFECDCGCGIVSIRLFDYDDKPMAEFALEPEEWLRFSRRLQKPLLQ